MKALKPPSEARIGPCPTISHLRERRLGRMDGFLGVGGSIRVASHGPEAR